MSNIKYEIRKASENDIYLHLIKCNDNFIPSLNKRVVIEEYSKKIHDKSVTFEAWDEKGLVGLVAVYFNIDSGSAYITNVSVLKENMRFGIASTLMNMCIEYANKSNMQELYLEVSEANKTTISFYKKLHFVEIAKKNDFLQMKLEILNQRN